MNRLAFLYADAGTDPNDASASGDYDDLISITQGIQGSDNAEHVAFFAPWVYVPTGTLGVNRLIPPVGYAAGARARAHNNVGPHQPGAGVTSTARFVNGIEFAIGSTLGDSLDAESINAIRIINNTIRIYGARSCSGDLPNFRYITSQDVLNHVVVESYRSLEDVLFRPIDARNALFVSIKQRLQSIMEELRTIGAIYPAFDNNGRQIDYGYTVICDSSINPLANLVNGTVTARVGLRVTGIGDSIQVDIIKSSLTASVV
jgi:phage tail sheath protein FI